ncbi:MULTISPECIES: hypothetical protein [Streptomyces]|uniref:hypothetical protein n=1 Tax=Streptomyces TaxID=1883 RepID=UPI001E455BAB|nr:MULTISPECIES: hypothetical protein [Streptomyces]UFQ20516.1 hypothetical protein J2N69_17015 [Streptomyces huasconensis]WCL90121.1 hypothetical protein PPN52_17025 [Streptomyces sp. JCM 35825]
MHRTGPRLPSGTHLLALDACVAALVTAAYVALAGQDASDGLPRFTGPWWLAWPVALGVGAPGPVPKPSRARGCCVRTSC